MRLSRRGVQWALLAALLGAFAGALIMNERSKYFASRAAEYAQTEQTAIGIATVLGANVQGSSGSAEPKHQLDVKKAREVAAAGRELRLQFEFAAKFPFLPGPTEPPPDDGPLVDY